MSYKKIYSLCMKYAADRKQMIKMQMLSQKKSITLWITFMLTFEAKTYVKSFDKVKTSQIAYFNAICTTDNCFRVDLSQKHILAT